MSPPCSNSYALKILLSLRGCEACSTTLDMWGHMGPGGGGPGAFPTSLAMLSVVLCGAAPETVQIPRNGDQGLMLAGHGHRADLNTGCL